MSEELDEMKLSLMQLVVLIVHNLCTILREGNAVGKLQCRNSCATDPELVGQICGIKWQRCSLLAESMKICNLGF